MMSASPVPPTSEHVEITPAEALAWKIMDSLEPDVRAQLMARIDNDEA
jgi:hypothetical protein